VGEFYQEQIAGLLKKAFDRIAAVERTLAIQARVEELEPSEPSPEVPTNHPGLSTYFWYTTQVVTTDEANRCFLGRIMVPTDSSSKWTLSNTWTYLQTVDVPEGLDLPTAGSVVGAFNTGPYAQGKTRFALFGAGGNSLVRCKIASVSDNQLTVVELAEGANTEVGSPFQAWLPWDLQRQTWDGQTLNSVSYSYLSSQNRVASQGSITEVHRIIPLYFAGAVVYVGKVKNSPGVSASTDDYLDYNVAGRAWSRVSS